LKAIILAAGYGTRLQPLTNSLPKPLVPVVSRPLLLHTILKLKKCKVTGIGINIHHNAGMLKAYLERVQPGLPIEISHEQNILGVAGGIGGLRSFLREEDFFIVHNGDVLSNIDLEKLMDTYRIQQPLCAMVLHDHPQYNNVSIDEEGNIADIRATLKPAKAVKRLAYTGISFMDSGFLRYIPEGPADLVPILLDMIKEGKNKVQAIIADECVWRDIGTVSSYFEAHKEILIQKKPLIDKSLIPRDPVFLGKGTRMEEGVALQGFVSAGENCLLRQGCCVENCIIWDNAVVEEGRVVKNSIIGNGWAVNVKSV
jgi:NDP-sugar pyrophosphorylase family protein